MMAKTMRRDVRFVRLRVVLFTLAVGLFSTSCQSYTDTTVKSKSAANETLAISALRTISSAQTSYSVSHDGDFGTFEELVKAGHLAVRFSGNSPVVGGYVLTMKVSPKDSSGSAASYAVNADPETSVAAGSTGTRHFFMDSTNTIHVNAKQSAGAGDPQL